MSSGHSTPAVATAGASAARGARGAAGPHRHAPRSSNNPLTTIGQGIPLPVPVPDWSKPIILALLLLAAGLGIRARMSTRRAAGLELQRAGLERDLNVAQAALVPEIPAHLEQLAVSVAYRPADGPAAGGDFYDVFALEAGRVAIILGDVAGHGHEALSHAALARYTLRAYLQAGLEPRAALALAGKVLSDPSREHFATVALAVFDSDRGTLTYALAGHPPPILRGPEAFEPSTLCSSPPIGWDVPTGRRQTVISLAPGSEAWFFSDGLIEARSRGELLGRARLAEILTAVGPRPGATDVLAGVRSAAELVPDDMAACGLRSEAASSRAVSHVEELEVDRRALTTGQVERFMCACRLSHAEITRVLERAFDVAGSLGTAVVRVDMSSECSKWSVDPPAAVRDEHRSGSSGGRSTRPGPSLAALPS